MYQKKKTGAVKKEEMNYIRKTLNVLGTIIKEKNEEKAEEKNERKTSLE